MSNSTDRALEGFRSADAKVQDLILGEAEKRVQANIGRIDALNQRLSALCALLFAGAAVAATYTTNADKVSAMSIGFACMASVVFACGGAIGCFGLISKRRIFPGEKPSWWTAHGIEALSKLQEVDAKGWLIEHREQMIDSLSLGGERRARCFNIALVFGAIAGGLIATAALTGALFGTTTKAKEPIVRVINFTCSNGTKAKPTAPPVSDPKSLPLTQPENAVTPCALFVHSIE